MLCKWCLPDAFPGIPSRCYRCQRIGRDSATCALCRHQTVLKHVWVATAYDDAAKQLLHVYKFERAQAAAAIIGDAMMDRLPYLPPETLIVPVPTASVRIRQRGYDHAALLAKRIAAQKGLCWLPGAVRLTQARQVGASRQQRHDQLKEAFMIAKPRLIQGASVLLVDDVLTTGATLETLAKALKQAGAKTVNAVVFAQKQ